MTEKPLENKSLNLLYILYISPRYSRKSKFWFKMNGKHPMGFSVFTLLILWAHSLLQEAVHCGVIGSIPDFTLDASNTPPPPLPLLSSCCNPKCLQTFPSVPGRKIFVIWSHCNFLQTASVFLIQYMVFVLFLLL